MPDFDLLSKCSHQRNGASHGAAVYRIQFCVTSCLKPVIQFWCYLFHTGIITVILKVITRKCRNQKMILLLRQRDDIFKIVPFHNRRMNQQNGFFIFISEFMNIHGYSSFSWRFLLLCFSYSEKSTPHPLQYFYPIPLIIILLIQLISDFHQLLFLPNMHDPMSGKLHFQ